MEVVGDGEASLTQQHPLLRLSEPGEKREGTKLELTREINSWAQFLHHSPGGAAAAQTWVPISIPDTSGRILVKGPKFS